MSLIVHKHTNIMEPEKMTSLEESDRMAAAVAKTVNRVSLDQILGKIAYTDYVTPERHPHMTLCILTLTNGFVVIGKSAPADPLNFNEELGRTLAREDAIREIWPLEAYALRERMTNS